jgi:hypothetical protein
VGQGQIRNLIIAQNEVQALMPAGFNQTRTDVTDIPSAFSSSPELGQFLTSQQVIGLYNAWNALTPQCSICAVQVPVLYFPNENAASMAYQRVESVNRMIFQNVSQQGNLGAYWDNSFCQLGDFASQQGTTRWVFCAMRKGNAVITVAIGGTNFDANAVLGNVRNYATRIETYLKAQFP